MQQLAHLMCGDEVVIPATLRIKPPVKTREGYRITEHVKQGLLVSVHTGDVPQYCELSSKVNLFQGSLRTELLTTDYQKVMNLSYRAAERTQNETKLCALYCLRNIFVIGDS